MESLEVQLIERARRGDRPAFWRLVEHYLPHLLRVASALTGPGISAEDVVQDSLVAALQGIPRFAARSSLRTWLVAIVVRQAALHRRRRRPTLNLDAVAEPATMPARSDVRLDVQDVLQRLSEEQRTVLVLREFEQMSYEEIASTLAIPRGTVESRLHRARQEVRRMMGNE